MRTVTMIAGAIGMAALCAVPCRAQDPAKSDPAHFKVELDNQQVRVLHVTVEPNTKIQLHEVDDALVVPLKDYESTLKQPDGQSVTVERKLGKAVWFEHGTREFESGNRGVDALLIEIKHAQ